MGAAAATLVGGAPYPEPGASTVVRVAEPSSSRPSLPSRSGPAGSAGTNVVEPREAGVRSNVASRTPTSSEEAGDEVEPFVAPALDLRPTRAAPATPVRALCRRIGLSEGGPEAVALEELVEAQVASTRRLVGSLSDPAARPQLLSEAYNAAADERIERIVALVGVEGARQVLGRVPFFRAHADGALTRLEYDGGRIVARGAAAPEEERD